MTYSSTGPVEHKANALGDVITRFAPSPTGHLHLGHAYSALINAERARTASGRFILRIEDIDQTRCRPAYDNAIFEDLAWLGLEWEEPVMRQSIRLPIYQSHIEELHQRGLVYRCFRSRKDIEDILRAPHKAESSTSTRVFRSGPLTQLEERDNMANGEPYAWRLSLDAAREALGSRYEALSYTEDIDGQLVEVPADADRFGDVVLGRKDSGTSYHLSSVIDDAAQNITHVIRGKDLQDAAGLHTLLQALLDLPYLIYEHHALVTNERGDRLSKRDNALALRSMRDGGMTPDDVRQRLPPY